MRTLQNYADVLRYIKGGRDFMNTSDVFRFLQKDIHTVVMATVNEYGLPETRVIDIMLYDNGGIYFLTAKGKRFYDSLIKNNYISISGFKGNDTLSSVAISVCGYVTELSDKLLDRIFTENPYMNEIYPTTQSRQALTVFKLCNGTGEYFDLSKKPIERYSFSFGNAENIQHGYFINNNCIACGKCVEVCPQNCIAIDEQQAMINHKNCLHCGNCLNICPVNAVERK